MTTQQAAVSSRPSSISSATGVTKASTAGATSAGYSTAAAGSQAVGNQKKGCCCRCWSAIFKCVGHDRIYGSFVGPHPVNFMCCFCKCCCKGSCVRPFVLASIATKLMWFLMLIFIIILSCFFIMPYPKNKALDQVAHFYPCGDKLANGTWVLHPVYDHLNQSLTCAAHGGYFMVYRNFFSYILLLLMCSGLMICVKSTKKNVLRAKCHHGFWMYKYAFLLVLLIIAFTAIRVEGGGIFEYMMSWLGLIASLIFSFIELTLLLDIVELFIAKNRSSRSDWADCFFWFVVVMVVAFNLCLVGVIGTFYLVRNHLHGDLLRADSGAGGVSILHFLIYLYGIFLSIAIFAVTIWRAVKTREYPGILRSLFLIAYIQGLIWSTLSVSPDIHARPHFNVYKSLLEMQPGNTDTYFKADGCFQGLSALVALMYFLFWHGPRSTKAPLSMFFDRVWYWKAKKAAVPVVPAKLSDFEEDQFCIAVQQYKVWDDEKNEVRYSWTLFYVVMILASFTIMMAMTNFSDPWAIEWYCSSYPAMGIKLGATSLVTAFYFISVLRCVEKVVPGEVKDDEELAEWNRKAVANDGPMGETAEDEAGKSGSVEQPGESKIGESSALPPTTTDPPTNSAVVTLPTNKSPQIPEAVTVIETVRIEVKRD